MARLLLPILFALVSIACFPRALRATSALEILATRSSQSLRGEVVDIEDPWTGARLLAHFGESRRAYDVLQDRKADPTLDIQAERFEARLLTELGRYARADSVLALQVDTGDLEGYYILCLQRARLNVLAGRYERALRLLSLVGSVSSPAFEPYHDFVALDALVSLERFGDAVTVGERRFSKGIPLSLSPRFEERLLDAYVGADALEDARRMIAVLKKRKSRARVLTPVLVREPDLALEMGDTLRAVRSALELVRGRATRSTAPGVIDRILDAVAVARMSSDALLEFCKVALDAGELERVDHLTVELGRRALDRTQRARWTLHLANLYFREKRYSKSYRMVRRRFDDASLERRAMLLRARIYKKTGQTAKAAAAYVDFATRYPYDGKAAEALLVAADLRVRIGQIKRSLEILERIMETYPSHRYARVATMKLSWHYIERGQYSKGIRILEKALERTGRRNEEYIFYLSEAYGLAGQTEKRARLRAELQALDPASFYLNPVIEARYAQPEIASNGRIAMGGDGGLMEFLRNVFSQRVRAYEAVRTVLSGSNSDAGFLGGNSVYLRRGRQFLRMGFRDWGEAELRVLESRVRLPARASLELGALYDDFAMQWKSVRAYQRVYYSLRRERRRSLDDEFKLLMYPVVYPSLVFENCFRYGLPPHLAYAMIRQESRFDLNAVSKAGAMGLMQLMPATGEEAAHRLGFPEGMQRNLLAPEVNLTFGIWYASQLLRRSNDDPLMMLSAYNAGFGNARRWFRGAGRRSVVAAVDGIDYRETRNYVKRIVENARVYHAFYFSRRPVTGKTAH